MIKPSNVCLESMPTLYSVSSSSSLSYQQLTSTSTKQNQFVKSTQDSKYLTLIEIRFSNPQGKHTNFSLSDCSSPPQLGPDFRFGTFTTPPVL